MDTEAGLSMTRNYDGCSHLEALYHAETETYFAFSYWDSYEKYETYLNWRLNDDQSGFVGQVYPLVKGGESGVKIHFNNSLLITKRCISEVPSYISVILASRINLSTPYSCM